MSTEKKTKEKNTWERAWAEQNVKKRFTLQERSCLVDLVTKHVRVVDSPEVDSASLQEKRQAWIQIKEDFNSVKSHNPRTAKQLKKAWDNHKTKIKKRMHLLSQYSDNNIEESGSRDQGSPVETRVQSNDALRDPDPELIETENYLGRVSRNIVPESPPESSAKPDGEVNSNQTTLLEMKSNPSQSREVSDHPSPHAKVIPTCALTHPVSSNNVKMSRRCREMNVQIECDAELLDLLKKEMTVQVEIAEIEKKKAEAELKLREEELTYKRKMWDLEIKILEKRERGIERSAAATILEPLTNQ